jgi:hypothetical protein
MALFVFGRGLAGGCGLMFDGVLDSDAGSDSRDCI